MTNNKEINSIEIEQRLAKLNEDENLKKEMEEKKKKTLDLLNGK